MERKIQIFKLFHSGKKDSHHTIISQFIKDSLSFKNLKKRRIKNENLKDSAGSNFQLG